MLRALCLATVIFALPLRPAFADAGTDAGGNAALKYWQAFAQLPKLTDAEASKVNAEANTMPLDARARELVAKADYALTMMRRGAALRHCDWGIAFDQDGIFALLPHVPAARTLASLACLRARINVQDGHEAQAVEDFAAALTLARHASLDGSLIGVLVGYNIEHHANEVLAHCLPKMSAGAIKGLKTRLDALPPFATISAGLLSCEKETLDWFVRQVKAAPDKDSLVAFLTKVVGAPHEKNSGPAFLKDCGGTAAGVLKYAEQARPSYDRLAPKLALPLDQFDKEFERETKRQAGNPVFKTFFPAIIKVRLAKARADERHALLAAALAVQVDGRDALKNHPDPIVGGPFEYAAFDGGFELRSKWTVKGPLVLTVGQRAK
jgi:hypothetical protein